MQKNIPRDVLGGKNEFQDKTTRNHARNQFLVCSIF